MCAVYKRFRENGTSVAIVMLSHVCLESTVHSENEIRLRCGQVMLVAEGLGAVRQSLPYSDLMPRLELPVILKPALGYSAWLIRCRMVIFEIYRA